MNRPQRSGWPALLTKPVAVVDRQEYDVLIADRELLSTAFVRQRIRTILGVFTLVMTAALLAFVGGFWVGQHTHDESFKAACSRVLDEALRSAKPQRSRAVHIEDVAAGPVHEMSRRALISPYDGTRHKDKNAFAGGTPSAKASEVSDTPSATPDVGRGYEPPVLSDDY